MRILFIVENYYPHVGGVEVVFKNLCEGLVKKGNKVTVLTHKFSGTKSSEKINGVEIHRIGGNRYVFSLLSVLKAIPLAKKADIIHTTTFNAAPPAWLTGKLTNKKVIITVHEVWIGMWSKLAEMGFFKRIMHDFGEKLIHMLPYDYYVAVSDSTRKQLLRIGINGGKIRTVHNAVDYKHFNSGKYDKRMRKKLNLGNKFVYLTYGRPGISKGIGYSIDAAALIKEKIPNSVFLLILSQDPAYRNQYQALVDKVEKLGLKEYILFLPQVSWKELPYYLKAADCVVVPSLAEGFGYTVAESCAMNVPVVASNTTSIPEVISGKFVLVKPKSAKSIAEGVELVKKGKWTKSVPKRFKLKDNISGYVSIYKQLLQSFK